MRVPRPRLAPSPAVLAATVLTTVLTVVLTTLLMAGPAAPARATYPGHPGDLAFGANVGGNVDIWSVDPDGGEPRRLTEDPGFDACAAYDPHGRRIAFCSGRSGAASGRGGFEIWTMRADGSRERQLTRLGGFALFPDFAPRGRTVAFAFRPEAAGLQDIWTVRDDGRHPRQLTRTPDQDEGYPAYSPDGRHIVYVRADAGGGAPGQLWIMDRDGSDQRQLTFDLPLKDQLPDWRPDGEQIAYQAGLDIWVIDPDGTGQVNVTNTPDVAEYGAAWSPDGERIAWMESTDRVVHTMRSDGTDVRPVATDLPLHFVPAWQPLHHPAH